MSDGFTITMSKTVGIGALHVYLHQRLMAPRLTLPSLRPITLLFNSFVALLYIGVGCWVTYNVRLRGNVGERISGA